jgi:hypothetical protein
VPAVASWWLRWWAAAVELLLATSPAAAGAPPLRLNLEVTTGRKAPLPAPASSGVALLVLNSMSDERRELLTRALHDLAVSLDRRKNPLFVPLDDREERKAVENLIAQTAPAFTAAKALLCGQWQSPEGDVWIRPVPRCAAQRTCIALQGRPSDSAEEKRARFLAWPLGHAIILRTAESSTPNEVADALRAPGSLHIGLVLTSAELRASRPSPALLPLQREARRVVGALAGKRTPFRETLASLANVRPGKNTMTLLKLPPQTILIVPRLGALATIEQFVEDVRTRLGGTSAKVEWLVSPR